MRYSQLSQLQTTRDVQTLFGGYNHQLSIGENEFYDMKNMTSSAYPLLSPRLKRGTYSYLHSGEHYPNGLIAKDALCYVDGNTLYINEYSIRDLLKPQYMETPRQLISMGAFLIVMPDKVYINTKNLEDRGDIEATFEGDVSVTYELCKVDGESYGTPTVSDTEPASPVNGALWIDTSSTPHTLKQYSTSSAVWVAIATTYVKIRGIGIGAKFKQWDGIFIDGITHPQLTDLNGKTSILYGAGDDYIIVVGLIDSVTTASTHLKLSRYMPNMDYITESENRLWGCRYGTDVNGNVVNEIYACKQGDFRNWHCYMGISTDSYAVSCGTDGAFTGAITHLGYPIFFKENCLHKIYGNMPSNYQVQTTIGRGVQEGSSRSLAIVGETLYYKSRSGVCVYDGSLPKEVSEVFGDIQYTDAVGGAFRNKYYLSMKSMQDSLWHLFVYDASKGMWHIEDNTRADAFCECRGDFYYIDHDSKLIRIVDKQTDNETIEWFAETGVLGTSKPVSNGRTLDADQKYVSRINVRMSLSEGSTMKILIQYDSVTEWMELYSMTGSSLRTFTVSLRPRRCDHFKLKFVGTGDVKVYSIAKLIENGSDVV